MKGSPRTLREASDAVVHGVHRRRDRHDRLRLGEAEKWLDDRSPDPIHQRSRLSIFDGTRLRTDGGSILVLLLTGPALPYRLPVGLHYLLGIPHHADATLVQPEDTIAEPLDTLEGVRDEDDGPGAVE